ncbi:MAG TPA: NUDIX hydrolase [Candidatus Dormibacteraeota bacterium]|nr:NUDIX hydrolase [Candidatus Dormibacteraeota bacterium]
MKDKRSQQARVMKSRLVYHGPLFDVKREQVREPGGVVASRDIVVHRGSIVLVPVLDDGRILMVRQYRHAMGQFLWELVAGGIEPGERPAAAAARELIEETGYTGRRFRRLTEFFPTPGFVSERMVIYLVKNLCAGTARPEADEKLRVGAFALSDLERKIRRGVIRDGKSIAGILFYARFAAPRSGRLAKSSTAS